MDKIFGLDLGTNSIGWALRNPHLNENQIEKFGVLTFNKGVGIGKTGEYSYAAARTKKRSTRRLYQSRKYRLWATLEHLIEEGYCPLAIESLNRWRKYNKEEALKNNNGGRVYPVDDIAFDQWIKLDFNGDGKPDYSSPYQLRKEIAEIELDFGKEINRFKLGRALYHIAQRRGFKSSRKGADDAKPKETGNEEIVDLQYSEKKRNKAITDLFEKYPEAKTIGWLYALLETDKIRIRESIAQYAIRENYKDEIKYIFQYQKLRFDNSLYKKLVETGTNKNDGSIFYKRPLRSQKGLIGKCTLEPNKYRVPISHPNFELFRAWSFINNIKYKPTNDSKARWQLLPLDLKEDILKEMFFRKSKTYFPFAEIADFISKKGNNWQFNYSLKTTVTGCPVSARLKDIFGPSYQQLQIPKKKAPKADKSYYDIGDIWHVLFSYEDQEFVAEFAEQKLSLSPEKVKQFLNAWNALPVGYGMLSLHAITKINRFLEKGLIYTEAVLLANMPKIIGQELWEKNESFFLENISKVIDENRRQKTMLKIVNNLVSQHKNLEQKFGYKDNTYQLDNSDKEDILRAIEEIFGESKWKEQIAQEQQEIIRMVTDCYQAYFKNSGLIRKDINGERHFEVKTGNHIYYKTDSGYYRLPKLIDTLREFLQLNFSIEDKKIKKIYHPSEISIYPPAKADKDGKIKLGSPKTGSFKNPMAMRTLHELRKLMNYMIETNQIDTDTRVVVEVARELNDSNKRWAIEAMQRQREAENEEFEQAIRQLLNKSTDESISESDTNKVRLFYEQNDEQTLPPIAEEDNDKKDKKKKTKEKDEAVRWNGHGKKLIDKYRLWVEQGYQCIYTGKYIRLSDLFEENVIDIEHTIPRSISFDNSLANQTVCFHDYNRTVKKKQIPTQLNNYDKDFGGYTAILPRLDKWKEKVERIKQQVDFWKTKSKKASDKDWKDDAIRQRHLWQMELDYWQNKLNRFTMKEITSGFKNSQKIDTQLISKYAFHYLKTYFEKVDVQNGNITSEFRKIYSLQIPDEKKDRSKHSHHAKDAAVLTLIPVAAKRDEILKTYYEHKEQNKNFTTEPYKGFKREFVWNIDESILINNVAKDQSLSHAKRKIRKRGKEILIPGTNKPMWATGDCIRGQLHQETFYGAIKPAKRGELGNILKDEDGKIIQEENINYVLRVPFNADFNSIDKIVDEGLKKQIKNQIKKTGSFKKAFEEGIYLLDKNGKSHGNKIRHIRVWASVSEPLQIKKQTNLSKADYKQHYLAANGENLAYGLYENSQKQRGFQLASLYNVSQLKKTSNTLAQMFEQEIQIKKPKAQVQLKYVLTSGLKVIFYDKDLSELQDRDNINEISQRMYVIDGFEKDGRIRFSHHMDSRSLEDLKTLENKYGKGYWQGFSTVAFQNPNPKLKLSKDSLNMVVEGYDFNIEMDGRITWKLDF